MPGAVQVLRPGDGAAFAFGHAAGARIGFVRPLRVVRYALVYLPQGIGAGAAELAPCLVRFETPLPLDGALPDWGRLLAVPATLPGSVRVVAEQVTGLQVDLSLGTGFPGIRGKDPAATAANLGAALGALGGAVDPADPLWFRKCAALVKVSLETRSPVARETAAGAGQTRGHQLKRQTLLLTPRNFGLEHGP